MDDRVFWPQVLAAWYDSNILELAAYACWSIWLNRNRSLHEGTCKTASSLSRSATTLHKEYLVARPHYVVQVRAALPKEWRPPDAGKPKMNTDASFSSITGLAKCGFVVRESMSSGDLVG